MIDNRFFLEKKTAFCWSYFLPDGERRTVYGLGLIVSSALTKTSTLRIMPFPPPYGLSSTILCLSLVKSRILTNLIFIIFFSLARLRMLDAVIVSNISGKRVKMKNVICVFTETSKTRPLELLQSQKHFL